MRVRLSNTKKDMAGLRLLVTAGPTQEAVDPVRYLTNHSTGSMGYAIARVAARRGALVTLVSGPTALEKPRFAETIDIVSAADMFREVTSRQPEHDIIIKAAAVADYRPAQVFEDKVKKSDGEMSIPLARTQDILQYLGEHRRKDSSSAASPWRRAICLKIRAKSSKRKRLT